jgi:hypothetical protein
MMSFIEMAQAQGEPVAAMPVDNSVGTPYQERDPGFLIVDNKLYIEAEAAADLTTAVVDLMDWLHFPNVNVSAASAQSISRLFQSKVDEALFVVAHKIAKGTEALQNKLVDDADGDEET